MNQKCIKSIFLLSVSPIVLCQCSTTPQSERGATAGAVVGGIVGAASGGAKGAVIGAASGGALGAVAGSYLERRKKELAAVAPTQKTDRGLLVTLQSDILFDFDKADLKPNAQNQLGELAGILSKYPKDELKISGYTDDIGTRTYNQKLSEKRAETVKDYLADKGLKSSNIKAEGLGEATEKAKTEQERRHARRVEIYIEPELPANQTASQG